MEFSMVGGIMLLLVLIIYLKMIDRRSSARQRKTQVQHWLDKAEVFESVADDKNALITIEAALKALPEDTRLETKRVKLQARLAKSEHDKN